MSALDDGLALLLALGVGIVLGVSAALRAGQWTDRGLMFAAGLGLTMPKFVAAPLVLLFAVTRHCCRPAPAAINTTSYCR